MNSGRASNPTSSNPCSDDVLQLQTLPEKEVFNRNIDSHHMRVEDKYKFRGDARGFIMTKAP